MKTVMKTSDLLDSPHYKSILMLTMEFQGKEKGLRQMHYRWALIKNHDGINQSFFVNNMKNFFLDKKGKNLSYYYKSRIIEKNCIQGKYPNHNLGNFLDALVNKYKVMETHTDDKGITRYTVTPEFWSIINRWEIKKWSDEWTPDKIERLFNAGMIIEGMFTQEEINPFEGLPTISSK